MRVRFAQHARVQLVRAVAHIDRENPPAAAALWVRVRAALRRVSRFPKAGHRVPGRRHHEYREVLVSPFRLIYREESSEIIVVAFVHTARDLSVPDAIGNGFTEWALLSRR